MHELIVFIHYKTGSDRVHKFQDSGKEEDEPYYISAEPLKPE